MTDVKDRILWCRNKTRHPHWEAMVPAGTYWLGDPCYCIDNQNVWMNLCSQWFSGDGYERNPLVHHGDHFVLGFSTQHGDGCYADNYGFEYGVDAGMIGLVPVGFADKDPGGLSRKVVFEKPTYCERTPEGVLTFGRFRINTD